jgi:hypothetical protein
MWPDWTSMVLATFAETQSGSPAGAKPGITEKQFDARVGGTSAMGSPVNVFLLANRKMDSQ